MPSRFSSSLLALLALPVSGCLAIPCGNEIVRVEPSPGGRYDAVLFQRSCGATTGFTTQISVLPRGGRPTGSGNAFVADDDHGRARPGAWNGPLAEMAWLGPDRLLIRYAARSRIFKQAQPEVRITYREAH